MGADRKDRQVHAPQESIGDMPENLLTRIPVAVGADNQSCRFPLLNLCKYNVQRAAFPKDCRAPNVLRLYMVGSAIQGLTCSLGCMGLLDDHVSTEKHRIRDR